jgi:hypothetical protein
MKNHKSGRRRDHEKKTAMEDCQSISIKELIHAKLLKPHVFLEGCCTGSFLGYVPEVGIFVNTLDINSPYIALSYTLINPVLLTRRPVLYQVDLSPQVLSDALRWLFCCPILDTSGSACYQRVSKLYLPRGKQFFVAVTVTI